MTCPKQRTAKENNEMCKYTLGILRTLGSQANQEKERRRLSLEEKGHPAPRLNQYWQKQSTGRGKKYRRGKKEKKRAPSV